MIHIWNVYLKDLSSSMVRVSRSPPSRSSSSSFLLDFMFKYKSIKIGDDVRSYLRLNSAFVKLLVSCSVSSLRSISIGFTFSLLLLTGPPD